MNVNIDIRLGEVDWMNMDPVFQKRLEDYMEANPEAGLLKDPSSLYRRLTGSYKALVQAVSEVLAGKGGDTARRESFTLVITVDGDKRVFPPGPRLY